MGGLEILMLRLEVAESKLRASAGDRIEGVLFSPRGYLSTDEKPGELRD